jgi:hypothetical protein
MTKEVEETVLQPSDIFRMMKLRHDKNAEDVLDTALKLLVYLKPGDKLKSGGVVYSKLSADLVHIGVKVSPMEIADTLEKRRIIRVPT